MLILKTDLRRMNEQFWNRNANKGSQGEGLADLSYEETHLRRHYGVMILSTAIPCCETIRGSFLLMYTSFDQSFAESSISKKKNEQNIQQL